MRQIKTHYSKVIGNEIIIRQVIELGVKMKLEEGQGDHTSCSYPVLAGIEGGTSGLCSGDCCSHTPRQPGTPGACKGSTWVSEQMGGLC